MGAFVLGVLVGWLAEWLFYTFWVKAGADNDDCSAIKAELELKNRQISSLQSQLSSASGNTLSKSDSPLSKQSAVSTTNIKSTTRKVPNTKANDKMVTKSVTKPTPKKTASKKTSATGSKAKSSTVKNSQKAKKVTTNTSAKSTGSKKAAQIKSKTGGDDFTKLSGIGPSMSATLKSLGIDTFQKLAATDDDILRDTLEASGARMNNNKEAMDSWNEQATVAATGDFKALKAMQAALKK